MLDPFKIEAPALISFSGGRTSAYMLWRILQAHGGSLPPDVAVAFANTGKERSETLEFIRDCEEHFGVSVIWLEWRPPPEHFKVVSFDTADRTGIWFAELIRRKQYLPNATMRYCTSELKVKTMHRWFASLGYKHWKSAIGLRYDEGMRVLKQIDRNESNKERFKSIMPLSTAKITKRDVMEFWRRQNFDLKLLPHEGNCDLCFLKSRDKLSEIIRNKPELAEWWSAVEVRAKTSKRWDLARFRKAESFSQLACAVRDQTDFLSILDDEEYDVECGLTCGGEE